MGRKRINISVPPDLYEEICERTEGIGLRSPCSFVLAAVRVALGRLRLNAAEDAGEAAEEPDGGAEDADYIRGMFALYEDWQEDPEHKARQGLTRRDNGERYET